MDAFRIGLAGGSGIKGLDLVARQTTACNLQNGDLYTFPNSTSTIDGTVPLTFTWNTRCPGISSTVDLYLYSDALGLIKQWGNIPFSNGQFQVQLLPRWWNSTTTARLQVNIQNSGGMSWNTIGPPGPWFKVDYPASAMLTTTTEGGMLKTLTNSAAATNGGDAIFQNVASTNNGGISKGAIAAAVVVPIIVIALIVGIAVKFWRQREAEKRKRWSQALSSTSNLDWEKGARPGERTGSIMGRPSMSSYGQPRASMAASSVWGENMAGAGAAGATTRPPVMRNVSNDGSASIHNPRISRISFAESARPERPDRRSRLSMGNDLRPHSAVFNLQPGSRSASDLPSSNLGPGSPSPSKKKAIQGMQGSAIVDDEDEKSSLGAGTPRMKSSRRGSQNSGNRLTVLDNEVRQSTYSAYSQQPSPQNNTSYDNDRIEDLSTSDSKSPLPTAQSTSTVAYGPDSLLQAYANRAQGATSPTGAEPMPMPMPMSMAMAPPAVPSSDSKKGLKIFTAFGKKDKDKNGSGQGESPTLPSPVGGLQVPNVAMTRNGGGTVGRGGSPSSPAPHAL